MDKPGSEIPYSAGLYPFQTEDCYTGYGYTQIFR